MSVNKVILLGRLGQDPELKYTPSQQPCANLSLATSESWTDKNGQKQERTEWTRVIVWGKLAELCNQYLVKGRQVYVEGKLQTRSWEDQSGQKRYTTEVVAKEVKFVGGRPENQSHNSHTHSGGANNSPTNNRQPEYNVTADANFASDDIPF